MKSRFLRHTLLAILLLTILLAFAACGRRPAPTVPVPIVTKQPTVEPTTLPPTAPSPTTIPPASTATPALTNTAAPTTTPPPPTPIAPTPTTVVPTPKPSDTPTPAPHAVVASEALNVRSGPGTQFEVMTRLTRGDALTVVGQSGRCNWLKVLMAQGATGWVARQTGGVELVTLYLPCETIPELRVPTPTARPLPPTHTPQPTPTASPQPPMQPPEARPQPTVLPPPPPPPPVRPPAPRPPPPPSQPGAPADKGCHVSQNLMGTGLNVTLSGSSGWQDSVKIPANGEQSSCLAPGSYNYTIDAPPPWADINGSLDVQAGSHVRFPIQGRP
jgi:hypothetical protein